MLYYMRGMFSGWQIIIVLRMSSSISTRAVQCASLSFFLYLLTWPKCKFSHFDARTRTMRMRMRAWRKIMLWHRETLSYANNRTPHDARARTRSLKLPFGHRACMAARKSNVICLLRGPRSRASSCACACDKNLQNLNAHACVRMFYIE